MYIIIRLKLMFFAQVRLMRYKYLDEFFSIKMDENTCLEVHIESMRKRKAYSNLVDLWVYFMPDDIAVVGVMRSLPPSYNDNVKEIVMKGEPFTFYEIIGKLRTFDEAPNPAEFIDDEGIYI
jgi:hypothetical protein